MNDQCMFCGIYSENLKTFITASNFVEMYTSCINCYDTLCFLYFTHCKVCGDKLIKHPNDSSKILTVHNEWILSEICLLKFIISYLRVNQNNELLTIKYLKYLTNLKKLYVCIFCYKKYEEYSNRWIEFNKIQPYEETIDISSLFGKSIKSLLHVSYETCYLNEVHISPRIMRILRRRLLYEIKTSKNEI